MTRSTRLAAALLIASVAAGAAHAANPKDVARAKNTRQIAECVRCDLSNADLRGGFFQLANMIDSNLSAGKFDGANMAGAQLNGANLSGASFVYTGLWRQCRCGTQHAGLTARRRAARFDRRRGGRRCRTPRGRALPSGD